MFDSDPHPANHPSDSSNRQQPAPVHLTAKQHHAAEQATDTDDDSEGVSIGFMLLMGFIMLVPGFLLFLGGILWLL